MKMIRKIALAELRHLFYSPVAWFVVMLFYCLASIPFFEWLDRMAMTLDTGKELIPGFLGWQDGIYKNMRVSGFVGMFRYLYMFLPLLTMGLMNREHISGSIKLLYAAPVKNREIILGKYLGLVCFNVVLLSGIALLLFTGYIVTENIPLLAIMSTLLGMFLLVNTYAAIGLFVSCLTKYQIVAAVLTFVLFYIMNALSGIGQQYDLIRDITYYLSFGSKASSFFSGLISTKDILYYLLIITLFLIFAMIKTKNTRESQKWQVVLFRYIIVFFGIVAIGYSTSRPGYIAYWDVTNNKDNTIHSSTQAVLKELDGSPVKVTLYTNLFTRFLQIGLPNNRSNYIWGFWDYYMRFYPNIKFDYVYYYDIKKGDSTLYKKYPGKNMEELAAIVAEYHGIRKSLFVKGSELRNIDALMEEDLNTVMEVSYKGKSTFLRTTQDGARWPQEMNVSGSLKRLLRAKEVKISFLTGHYERDAFSYSKRNFGHNTSLRFSEFSLIDRGVDIETVSVADQDVPSDVTLLVVADPRSAYSTDELSRLDNYIQKGGNAMIFAEPGKQAILNPLLAKIGVHIEDGVIVQPNKHGMAHVFGTPLTREGNFMSMEFERFQKYGIDEGYVSHEGVAHLTVNKIDGFTATSTIIKSGDSTIWIDNSVFVADSATPVLDAGDIQLESYVTSVYLTRKIGNKEQRIIVSSDADYLSAKYIDPKKFNQNFYSWLMNNEYPIYTPEKIPGDRFLKVDQITASNLKNLYVYILPVICILVVSILLLRRNKK